MEEKSKEAQTRAAQAAQAQPQAKAARAQPQDCCPEALEALTTINTTP